MAVGFSEWSDEKLLKAMEKGLDKFVEHNLKADERAINMYRHDIAEYHRKIKSAEWLLERAEESLEDYKKTHERIQKLKGKEISDGI